MPRTCYLHVGMMKTGTTAIQRAFAGYDDGELRYPSFPSGDHQRLLKAAYRSENSLDRSQALQELERGLQGDDNVILSAEMLSHAYPRSSIEDVYGDLSKYFDSIRVIAYVREPVGFMRSLLQQRTKGHPVTGFDLETCYPQYRRRLGPWIELDANAQLAEYSRPALRGGDATLDFAARVGADPRRLSLGLDANASLSAEAFAVLFAGKFLSQQTGAPEASSHDLAALLSSFGYCRFIVDEDLSRRVCDRHAEDLEWVANMMGAPLSSAAVDENAIVFGALDDVINYARVNARGAQEYVERLGQTAAHTERMLRLVSLLR